ncbi:MAG: hypothetical protein ACI8W3_003363, partial [Myxococcota bacterium]
EDCRGIVPWLSTDRLQLHPSLDNQKISSAPAGAVARVHDKAFANAVAESERLLPRAMQNLFQVLDPELLLDPDAAILSMKRTIASWPGELGHNFTIKPRLGTSGRGRVPGVDGKVDSAAVRGALKRLAKRGGAILEPWFKRKVDLSAQMHISEEGAVTILGTLEQIVAPSGVYLGHRAEFDSRGRVFSGSIHEEEIRETAAIASQHAFAEGFYGPCGIDAFSAEIADAQGVTQEVFRPIVEFNARFTMGTITIGLLRRALEQVKEPLALEPGERRAFYFGLDAPDGGWEANAANVGERHVFIPLWHPDDALKPGILFAETASALDPVVAAAKTPKSKRQFPESKE